MLLVALGQPRVDGETFLPVDRRCPAVVVAAAVWFANTIPVDLANFRVVVAQPRGLRSARSRKYRVDAALVKTIQEPSGDHFGLSFQNAPCVTWTMSPVANSNVHRS